MFIKFKLLNQINKAWKEPVITKQGPYFYELSRFVGHRNQGTQDPTLVRQSKNKTQCMNEKSSAWYIYSCYYHIQRYADIRKFKSSNNLYAKFFIHT